MLSNAYFLAKFRFDTAENEPAKNLQNFRKMHFSKNAFSKCSSQATAAVGLTTVAPTTPEGVHYREIKTATEGEDAIVILNSQSRTIVAVYNFQVFSRPKIQLGLGGWQE